MSVVPPWSLAGRLAVITGFGAGIGRATATAFARAGARVAGLDIDVRSGERTARELGAEGGEAVFISCDTGDAGAVESAFATIADTIGPVDILVNNAEREATRGRKISAWPSGSTSWRSVSRVTRWPRARRAGR